MTVKVLENSEASVHGAYVIVYTQTGIGYGLSITDESGEAVFKLPTGIYDVEAHYRTGYWLSVVTTSATEPDVSVHASTSQTIVLTDSK